MTHPHVYARTKGRPEVNRVFSSAALLPHPSSRVYVCAIRRGLSAVRGTLLSSLADTECAHTVNKHSSSPTDPLCLSSSSGDFSCSFFLLNPKCLLPLVNFMETKCLKKRPHNRAVLSCDRYVRFQLHLYKSARGLKSLISEGKLKKGGVHSQKICGA